MSLAADYCYVHCAPVDIGNFCAKFLTTGGVGQARMSLGVVHHGHWKKVFGSSKKRGGGAGSGTRTYGPAYVTRQFLGSQVGR
jgi:hypothetical protein